jgi:hypothetical protein
MTPKEKADELVGKFYVNIPLRDCDNKRPHKLALIAVDLIIYHTEEDSSNIDLYEFYLEVKNEIKLL